MGREGEEKEAGIKGRRKEEDAAEGGGQIGLLGGALLVAAALLNLKNQSDNGR